MKTYTTYIDDQGNLVLPLEVAQQLGLTPGSKVTLEENQHTLSISRPITSLNRVYIEVTNQCNPSCTTFMRNIWDAEAGRMSLQAFEGILEDIKVFSPIPEIFFGVYGEPLSNPECLSMIEQAKDRGLRVSMITNGTLLTRETSQRLIDLQMDMLWVSLDGASPECFADIRLGNEFHRIIENLKHLRTVRFWAYSSSPWAGYPRLGIAFVAMKRNIKELIEVINLGTDLGAVEFSITNVLAQNQSLRKENLYQRSMNQVTSHHPPFSST